VQDGDGEDRNHEGKGGRGGVGQEGKEADAGAGEGREREGGEAARPDAGAGLGVGHASPPAARLSPYPYDAPRVPWPLLSPQVTPALVVTIALNCYFAKIIDCGCCRLLTSAHLA